MKDWVETMVAFLAVMAIVMMGCDEAPTVPREVDRKASDATTNEFSIMEQEQKEMMVGMPKKKDKDSRANTKKGDPGGGEDPGASGGGGGIPGKID